MKGSIKQAGDGVWRLRVDLGYDAEGKRKQKMETFKGTKKEAQTKLRDLLTGIDGNTYVESRRLTLGQWLTEWIATQQQVGKLRASSLKRYTDIIRDICKTAVSMKPLQKLTETDLERYYATVSEGQRGLHHTVIRRALRRAVKERLITTSPAVGMENAPRRPRQQLSEDAKVNCWSAEDARKFLETVKQTGPLAPSCPQTAAFFAFMLDTGARKNEGCGLMWSDLDVDAGTVTIERQLLQVESSRARRVDNKADPVFGPTKSGAVRTISLSGETLRLLQEHKRRQAELKMANRTIYRDHGLVFAKGWMEAFTRKDHLGEPLQSNNLGARMLDPLIAKAGVKRITVHGLRHTAATLMLLAGIPVHVVAARLGHANATITLSTYAHVLKTSHQEAAATLGRVLHGA